jgi:predicted MFS family arabinose efflux permease
MRLVPQTSYIGNGNSSPSYVFLGVSTCKSITTTPNLISSIVCVGNVLVTNLVAADEQSVGGALFQTSYTVGFALGNNLTSLVIQRLGNDTGDLLHGLRASSGLNTACAWISKSM